MNKANKYLSQFGGLFEGKFFQKIGGMVENPYIISAITIIVVFTIAFMAKKSTNPMGKWLTNPIFKLIYIFAILGVHKVSPKSSILLIIISLITAYILLRYESHTPTIHPDDQQYQKPTEEENIQINQELSNEIASNAVAQGSNVLHPFNRPTKNTLVHNNRIEDPDDPRHPGWNVLKNPAVNVAIFELNPPFAKGIVSSGTPTNTMIDVPEGGPTRYSAYHGYEIK